MAIRSDVKVFLSHSSKDREFVERVFSFLGPDRSFIDQYAFEDGADISEAIAEKIGQSTIFCLFLSRNSIPSKWVKAEARMARRLAKTESGLGLLFYLIDETPRSDCPSWISTRYLIRSEKNPELAAKRIRRAILEHSSDSIATQVGFVGRQEEIQRLDKILGLPPR